MKKLLLISLISGTVFAQNVSTTKKEIQIDDTFKTVKKVTGTIQEFYDNGKVKSSISYKGDRMHGIRKEYYQTGKLIAKIPYKEGNITGVFKAYNQTGKLRFEIPFKNNIVDGIFKTYYDTGKLQSVTPFVNGRKDGIGKAYNETGKLQTVLFKDGMYNDIIKIYSDTNTLLIDILIEDGKVTNNL